MKTIVLTALVLAVALPVSALQAQSQPTTLPAGSAMVSEVKGKVSLRSREGNTEMAQRGMVLPPETTIDTLKGSVILLLPDGSQVLVRSKTQVVLKDPHSGNGYTLEMLIGEIMAKIKKRLGEMPPFRMGTPSAVITVRGTQFTVEVSKKGRTTVEVFEGVVEVEGVGEKPRAVLVRPGFRTEVQLNRQPDPPSEINALVGPRLGPQMGQPGQPGAGTRPGGQQPGSSEGEGKPDD